MRLCWSTRKDSHEDRPGTGAERHRHDGTVRGRTGTGGPVGQPDASASGGTRRGYRDGRGRRRGRGGRGRHPAGPRFLSNLQTTVTVTNDPGAAFDPYAPQRAQVVLVKDGAVALETGGPLVN